MWNRIIDCRENGIAQCNGALYFQHLLISQPDNNPIMAFHNPRQHIPDNYWDRIFLFGSNWYIEFKDSFHFRFHEQLCDSVHNILNAFTTGLVLFIMTLFLWSCGTFRNSSLPMSFLTHSCCCVNTGKNRLQKEFCFIFLDFISSNRQFFFKSDQHISSSTIIAKH